MSLPVAINGVGRIGRALIRQLTGRDDLHLVAANDTVPVEQIARLLRRDTHHGPFPCEVESGDGRLVIGGHTVPVYHEPDISRIPWRDHGARLVVEATGAHTHGRLAEAHIGGGIEHVILTSNAPDADITVCYGVNHQSVDPAMHRLVSSASCTTNCLAVVAHLLDQNFGIERALLNTVHCFNNTQPLTDAPHPDARRARAASVNMVPTTTGASSAIGLVLPALVDRLAGFAVRVPAAQVSLIDLVADLRTEVTVETINDLFREASLGEMKGILEVCTDPLVSSDFMGDTHSAVVDALLTQVVAGRLARIVAWYDNEMGYASRLVDLAVWLGRP